MARHEAARGFGLVRDDGAGVDLPQHVRNFVAEHVGGVRHVADHPKDAEEPGRAGEPRRHAGQPSGRMAEAAHGSEA